MGSPATEAGSAPDERPQHRVVIARPFYLAECEVTNDQFRVFVKSGGYRSTAETNKRGGRVYDMITKAPVSDINLNWMNPGYPAPPEGKQPVVQVTHDDARAFCEWLSREEGWAYRLPTEAEWEYACRAGTTTAWSIGDDPAALDGAAWMYRNADYRLYPVGLKAPNPWGLYDMHGNAWEWVADWYGVYPAVAETDPLGPPSGESRVLRGGSWDWGPEGIRRTRSASRLPVEPASPYFTYGFRIAMTPPRVAGPPRPE